MLKIGECKKCKFAPIEFIAEQYLGNKILYLCHCYVTTTPEKQPLVITPANQESYRPPREALLSSEQVGWNGIRPEYHNQPPHQALEHFHPQWAPSSVKLRVARELGIVRSRHWLPEPPQPIFVCYYQTV